MSIIPLINNGMTGSVEASVLLPTCATNTDSEHSSHWKPFPYGEYTKAPKLMSDNIDYSSRRQVLPCKSIIHNVLRREPMPAAGAYVPSAMPGRHNPIGLSSLANKPQTLPLLPISDPNNSGGNSMLGQPR